MLKVRFFSSVWAGVVSTIPQLPTWRIRVPSLSGSSLEIWLAWASVPAALLHNKKYDCKKVKEVPLTVLWEQHIIGAQNK
jgi:hypothetical protein